LTLTVIEVEREFEDDFIRDAVTEIPEEKQKLFNLIMSLLEFNPDARIFGEHILRHPFMQMGESVENMEVS